MSATDPSLTALGHELSPRRTVIEAILVTVLALIVGIGVGVVALVPLIGLGYDIDSTVVLAGLTAAGQVGILLVGVGYLRYREVTVPIRVPSREDLGYIVGGTVVAVALAVVLSTALDALDMLPESVIDEIAETDPAFLLALAVLSIVLVAPAEELLFRGVIQGLLRARYGQLAAIVGASLLFGSLHLGNYTGAVAPIVVGALLVTIIGVILGALYEWTENLTVPVVVHAAYNVILLVSTYIGMQTV